MKNAYLISDFLITLILTFAVSAVVTFLYNIIVHSQSVVDWGTSVRLAIILGVLFPLLHYRENKKKS